MCDVYCVCSDDDDDKDEIFDIQKIHKNRPPPQKEWKIAKYFLLYVGLSWVCFWKKWKNSTLSIIIFHSMWFNVNWMRESFMLIWKIDSILLFCVTQCVIIFNRYVYCSMFEIKILCLMYFDWFVVEDDIIFAYCFILKLKIHLFYN